MPQATFFNLPDDKRRLIVSAAFEEFSSADYNTASINKICRRSHIAKGSFYQYFTDKLDLYVYIMTLAIEEKIRFFSHVLDEFNTLTLKEQIRLLYNKGIEFAKNYAQYAALGEQFSRESHERAKSSVIKEGNKQSETLFAHMIDKAKAKGEIDNKVDTLALSLMLQSLNNAVNQYMVNKYERVKYEDSKEDVNKFIDSLIDIIFNGIESKI